MKKSSARSFTRLASYFMVALGVLLVVVSAFISSSYLAIVGVALVFWGAVLLYIAPTKHVPLALLEAAASSSTANIERALTETGLTEKGRYLPPSCLRDFESSVVFIPGSPEQGLPKPEEVTEDRLLLPNRNLLFLTPPGQALSQLFEREAGTSFTKTDLDFVKLKLPKLFVEDLELAQTAELQVQEDKVTLQLGGSVLKQTCLDMRKLPRTHIQVGCLLSSAVACVLAKASGKVVIIQKEDSTGDGESTVEYQLVPTANYATLPEVPAAPSPQPKEEAAEAIVELVEGDEQKVEVAQEEPPIAVLDSVEEQKPVFEEPLIPDKPPVEEKAPEAPLEKAPKEPAAEEKTPEEPVAEETVIVVGELLDADLDPRVLRFLEDNGEVFALADLSNPQFHYDRIKNYEAKLSIKFERFVEVYKESDASGMDGLQGGLSTVTYSVNSPADARTWGRLDSYVAQSGFSSVDEWLKASGADRILAGLDWKKKTFFLYHIQTTRRR